MDPPPLRASHASLPAPGAGVRCAGPRWTSQSGWVSWGTPAHCWPGPCLMIPWTSPCSRRADPRHPPFSFRGIRWRKTITNSSLAFEHVSDTCSILKLLFWDFCRKLHETSSIPVCGFVTFTLRSCHPKWLTREDVTLDEIQRHPCIPAFNCMFCTAGPNYMAPNFWIIDAIGLGLGVRPNFKPNL